MGELLTASDDLADLRRLLADLQGCNANDQARVLIQACLEEGIRKGSEIVATLVRLGFNKKHVGVMLAHGCGTNAKRFDWRKEPDGTYTSNT